LPLICRTTVPTEAPFPLKAAGNNPSPTERLEKIIRASRRPGHRLAGSGVASWAMGEGMEGANRIAMTLSVHFGNQAG